MTVARYHRVSTDKQELRRQTNATADYATREFPETDTEVYADVETGTNTDRDGYQQLLADAEAGDIDAVVVNSVSRICRSIRDLERTAKRLEDEGVALHIVKEGLVMRPEENDPYQRAMFQLLGVFAELEANMTQQRVKEGIAAKQDCEAYHHGPAPLGYEKNDGELIPSAEYDRVCAVLNMVATGECSKRQAAKRLDCARSTIARALERDGLYAIESEDPTA